MRKSLLLFALGFLFTPLLQAQSKVKILLVGTVHEFQDSLFQKQSIDKHLDRLRKFAPGLICVESIPTWDTLSLKAVRASSLTYAQRLRSERNLNNQNLDAYLRSGLMEVNSEPENLIYRSRLANYLYANHDFWNAYYHWFLLQERLLSNPNLRTKELSETFVLDSIHTRVFTNQLPTEFGRIIFPLANQLSINYLENIDDRSDDAEFSRLSKKMPGRLLLNLKLFKALRFYNGLKKESMEAERKGMLIEKVNSESFQSRLVNAIDELPTRWVKGQAARRLQELWYLRNRRMADRIVAVTQKHKADCVVVFVGAAHLEFIARELRKNPGFEVQLYLRNN